MISHWQLQFIHVLNASEIHPDAPFSNGGFCCGSTFWVAGSSVMTILWFGKILRIKCKSLKFRHQLLLRSQCLPNVFVLFGHIYFIQNFKVFFYSNWKKKIAYFSLDKLFVSKRNVHRFPCLICLLAIFKLQHFLPIERDHKLFSRKKTNELNHERVFWRSC